MICVSDALLVVCGLGRWTVDVKGDLEQNAG